MRKFAGFVTTLSLALAATTTAPALAQGTAAAAVKLDAGTIVYDSEGKEIGPVSSNDGTNVVIALGDKQVALPIASFGKTDKGPALGITVAELTAGIEQQAAASAAALDGALTAGADIRSAKGKAIVGKVKSASADAVVVTTAQGDFSLPRTAFFMSADGLATSFTAEQFAAAVAEAKAGASADTVAETAPSAEAQPAQQASE